MVKLRTPPPTWKRFNRQDVYSRIDFILATSTLGPKNFRLDWGIAVFDHAQLTVRLEFGPTKTTRHVVKDWILQTTQFIIGASDIIEKTLLDNSIEYGQEDSISRHEFVAGRLPRDYVNELTLTDMDSGRTHAHVLMTLISKLSAHHAQVQKQMSRDRAARLRNLQTSINRVNHSIEQLPQHQRGGQTEALLLEELTTFQQQIASEAELTDLANRQRIRNFYLDNNGKNTAASFYVTKEQSKRHKNITLRDAEGHLVTDPVIVAQMLHEKHSSLVGVCFVPEMTLTEFLRKYGFELPTISEQH